MSKVHKSRGCDLEKSPGKFHRLRKTQKHIQKFNPPPIQMAGGNEIAQLMKMMEKMQARIEMKVAAIQTLTKDFSKLEW